MKNRRFLYISYLLDLIVINLIVFLFFEDKHQNIYFNIYLSILWLVSSVFTNYYKVYRFSHYLKIITLIIAQLLIFSLGFFAFFGLFKEGIIVNTQFKTLAFISCLVSIKKIILFQLKKYKGVKAQNKTNVVIVGFDNSSKKIAELFTKDKFLGYNFLGYFSDKKSDKKNKGIIDDMFDFVLKNSVHEIYCSITSLSKETIKQIEEFSKLHSIEVKLIPENTKIYSKNKLLQYYGVIPVLKSASLPFEKTETHIIKRIFDVVFSLFIIVFLMSWLVPLMYIIIKLESKGPLFFKQKRTGLNGKDFFCYKFRSMKTNEQSDKKSATKNDIRITKVGAFIRKTSIDELPQFFNVFLGDMSVVGPRPHMNSQNIEFEKDINNYIKRHLVKPGITGLAQINGCRGEIRKRSDIENRVRYDIFYIENWSFLLDIKIIFQTIFNVFKGEEKAY